MPYFLWWLQYQLSLLAASAQSRPGKTGNTMDVPKTELTDQPVDVPQPIARELSPSWALLEALRTQRDAQLRR